MPPSAVARGHRRPYPIRVDLARDPARLLLWLGLRLAIAEVGIVVGLHAPGAVGIAVTVAGVAVLGYVVLLAAHVLSLRLEVRPGEIHAVSLLVRRRYRLGRGTVERLRADRGRAAFGTQLGSFGIEIGAGRSPADEPVQVIRLAAVSSMVLIPTAETPLAVAPSSERRLLRALEPAGRHGPVGARAQTSGARASR
jgi:hypothetical protein